MNVYLIGYPEIDFHMLQRFFCDEGISPPEGLEFNSPAENLVEFAGRLCYMSFNKGRKTTDEFISNIIKAKHFSVLEHANFTFVITGVSRSLTHELVRHRHFSFSQLSQRYVDHSEMMMVVPQEVIDAGLEAQFLDTAHQAMTLYNQMSKEIVSENENKTLARKAVQTAARAILPNATETKIVVTGNVRAWREFIEKRNTEFADPEIRELAQRVLEDLRLCAYNFVFDLE